MKSFVYPAIFIKDDEDNSYKVLFPDLEITTDGQFVEEAFLYAKELLKAYFVAIMKYDLDFNMPTDFDKVRKSSKSKDLVMLISADVTKKDIA
ncbi:MAG: type II toxin-antitoxin system HicB family antitoxin [Clostridia bacterium]|nr:type II toxin-antitoxin system HicB family antitoxin [Clostridia bacterium]MBQ8792633.1 type II toxin-antitoxin system HicB family antitoxin [Clostridia bacterium]